MALFDIAPVPPMLLIPLLPLPLCSCVEWEDERCGKWLLSGGGGGSDPDTLAAKNVYSGILHQFFQKYFNNFRNNLYNGVILRH